jgi:hypothetical protein
MTAPKFDPATGEIVSDDAEPRQRPNLRVVEDPEKVRLKAEIEILEGQVKDLERDIRGKRAAIRRLTNEREKERQAYARREEVELWFTVWQVATNHPKSKLSAERFDAIRKAIDLGYELEHWELVCEFAGALPYGPYYKRKATGPENDRRDDPHLLVRHFEHFARQGWEMKRRGTA